MTVFGKDFFNKMKDNTQDCEMIVFVERNNFVVLQTTNEFENKSKIDKLKFIDYVSKSLTALEGKVMGDQ